MVYRALEAPSVQIQVKCRKKSVTGDLCSCHSLTPFLLLSRSSAWTSSQRLPTWLTTHPWRTPLSLASSQPASRPPRSLWVSCQIVWSHNVLLTPITLFLPVFLCCPEGTGQLVGVSGEDFGVSGQVVCHWWDPALPAADPLQRARRTHGNARYTETPLSLLSSLNRSVRAFLILCFRNLQVHLYSQEAGHPQRAPGNQEPAAPHLSEYRQQSQPQSGRFATGAF